MNTRPHRLTAHAQQRLEERSSIRELEALALLAKKHTVLIGFEECTSIAHHVLYIKQDKNFLVAVLDTSSFEVITFLPTDYWFNLSVNGRYRIQSNLTKRILLRAVALADPEDELVNHPPARFSSNLHLFVRGIRKSDGKRISKAASIQVGDFINLSDKAQLHWIETSVSDLVRTYPMEVEEIIAGSGKKLFTETDVKLHFSICSTSESIQKKLKNEFQRRFNNQKNFPIFDRV